MKVQFPTTPRPSCDLHRGSGATLIEAVVLVFLVMYLFLQNFRATLIPTIAVPVVLLGTFGVLAAFGFSINTLTMFAMVLAIGLLVDDAIVVVENVERVMSEEGLPPKEATRKSMGQITGALVGGAGAGGGVRADGLLQRLHRRDLPPVLHHHRLGHDLSVLVALVLTPALCATLLKPAPRAMRWPPPASSAGSTASSIAATALPGHRAPHAGPRLALHGCLRCCWRWWCGFQAAGGLPAG
jgi:HAE1 family hydrophobic/amphiphilic exporter-1/multidrug efflux pump